jgi:hypothetical protein
MVTHKKHSPHVTLMALANPLPLSPRNLAISSPQVYAEGRYQKTSLGMSVVGNREPCCGLMDGPHKVDGTAFGI